MNPIDLIIFTATITFLIFIAAHLHRIKYEGKWEDMLRVASFRYQTDCYMKGIYPAFETVEFIKPLPYFKTHWKHMVPKYYYALLEPYMEELKNDPRFKS